MGFMIANKLIIIIAVLAIWLNSLLYAENDDAELKRQLQAKHASYEQHNIYMDEIERSFAEQMEKELNLRWMKAHELNRIEDSGNIEKMAIEFYAYRRATIEEARALELLIINKFLKAINSHEKIRPYLKERPFTVKHVGISIKFVKANGWEYGDGSVNSVYNNYEALTSQNQLRYYSTDPSGSSSIPFEETYEEAVRINMVSPIKNPAVHETTEKEEEMNLLLTSFKQEMSTEYYLSCWSIGWPWTIDGKTINDIEEISSKFTSFHPVTQEEARELIVLATEKLLKIINNNETLRPYLKEYPFPANRVKMRICFRNNRYGTFHEGSMEDVTLEGDEISYFQRIPSSEENKEEKLILTETIVFASEPYQEAVKIVENTPPPSIQQLISKVMRDIGYWFSSLIEDIYYAIFWMLVMIFSIPSK